MTPTSAAELAQLAQVLNADDRLELIDRLWARLADHEVPLTDEQRAEWQRRNERLAAELAVARPVGKMWVDLNRAI